MANKMNVKGYADGIPVYCAHDAIVAVEDVHPNPENPNMHPDEQLRRLGMIIRNAGWRNPITVSTRSGLIVRGHGRLAAAHFTYSTRTATDWYSERLARRSDSTCDNALYGLKTPS